jgi:Condensation domain
MTTDRAQASIPASLTQWRIWFDAQTVADPLAYNASVVYRLPSELDLDRFARALEAELASHAELRYAFVLLDWQLVKLPSEYVPTVERVRVAGEQEALARAREIVRSPLEPQRGITVRAAVFAYEGAALLAICCHHLVCDAESFDALLHGASRRLAEGDFRVGTVENLYERVATRPQHGVAAARGKRPAPGVPARLPADGTRPQSPPLGDALTVPLEPSTADALRQVLARFRIAPFCAVATAFALGVRAVAPDGPVVASFPVTLRRGGAAEANAVGPFLTYVTVALDPEPARPAAAFVKDVWAALLDAIGDPEHGEAARMLEAGRPEHRAYSLGYVVLARAVELGGVHGERVLLDPLTAKFDLIVSLVDDGGTLQIAAQYALETYRRETVLRQLARMCAALEALAASAGGASVGDLLPAIRAAGAAR